MSISVEVSWGELIDKYTILQIKLNRIKDENKLKNIQTEINALKLYYDTAHFINNQLIYLEVSLQTINNLLWDIEDNIRDCEREQDFGTKFIELARNVYHFNDKRAEIKREINLLLNSNIIEEKSYKSYNV